QLKGEVTERHRAEEEHGKVRETLESQLQNRTDDLKVAHEHLKSEVTVRQRVEEELGKVRETLESQLQNRTDDLKAAHEQLKSEVNERQRAEEAQRSQNEFIENVVQNIKDGLVVFDRDLRITYWNNAMEEISGTAADEVLGKVALEVFPHLIEEGVDELLKAALAGQDAARSNISHKTSNGKVRRTNERYLPMRDLAGDVTGALAIVEDVTEALRLKLYVDHLEEEFKECMLVDIAMGIIIQEFALSAAQGYRLIKKHSLDKKRKVGEVAMEIITLFGSPEEQKKSGKRFIGSIDE
ncbi:MAG: PAS domain-containing protein, partial [Nitrospinae bacterium]|nr:PAS domain-containing protein [Nitrospinota bacterium]